MTLSTLRAYLGAAVPYWLLCTVALVGTLTAQDSLRYAGPYRLAGVAGTATFDYQLDRGDTLRRGPFAFRSEAQPPVTVDRESEVRAVRGRFAPNGQPDGDWAFVLGRYVASGPGTIVDFEYRLPLTGQQRTIRGRLANGRAAGAWTLTQLPVVQGTVGDTLLRSRYEFSAGVPQLTFRLANENAELLGRLNRQGVADDEWVFYQNLSLRETWRFREGLLASVLLIGEYGDSLLLPVFDDVETTELMALGPAYFQLLAAWQELLDRPADVARGAAAELLAANAAAYSEVRAMLSQLASAEALRLPRVRVPSFPLSRADSRALTETVLQLKQIDTLATHLRSASNLAIIGSADPEAAFALATLDRLTGPFLVPVRKVAAAYEAGLLAHLPRTQFYAAQWPTAEVNGTFEVEFTGGAGAQVEAFTGPDARTFRPVQEGATEIRAMTEYALRSVNSLRTVLRDRLNTRERRQIVSAYEDQLAVEYARLDSLIGAQPRRLAREYQLRVVRERAQELIRQYNSADETGIDDEERIQSATACLQDLEALTLALTELPARAEEVRDAYTDQVWNNNTATLMNERVKRRLIDAYEEVLLPYFRTSLTAEELNCTRARQLEAEIRATHVRLLELRTAETNRLEDSLRNVDEDTPNAPTLILNLLDIATPQ